jgi:hypothetical protein
VKLKMTRRQGTILAVVVLVIIAVLFSRGRSDDSGRAGLDTSGRQACDDFARGYPAADTKAERLTLADKVTASSGKTDNKQIQLRAADMGTASGDGGAKWKSAADALTAACRDAGWTAP